MPHDNLTPLTKDVSLVSLEGFNSNVTGAVVGFIPGLRGEEIPYFIMPEIVGLQTGGVTFLLRFAGLLKFKTGFFLTAGATGKIHTRDSETGEWVEQLSVTATGDEERQEEVSLTATGYVEIRVTVIGNEAVMVPKSFHFLSESGKSFVETAQTPPSGNPTGYTKEYVVGVGFVWRPYWAV